MIYSAKSGSDGSGRSVGTRVGFGFRMKRARRIDLRGVWFLIRRCRGPAVFYKVKIVRCG